MEFNKEVWNWAKANNVKIWLSPTDKTYVISKKVYNKTIKRQVPYVNICISLDGNNRRFKDEYRQDDIELPSIINKLYKYYYDRANG
jgi:hypothetical protein